MLRLFACAQQSQITLASIALGIALVCSTAAPSQAQTTCPKEITSSASCGCTATANVSLKADMLCMNTDGIIVGASGITIRVNGFRIQCTDPTGYGMSCQGGTRLNNTGLKIVNRSNVTVRGSGAIQGFDTGVLVEGGSNIDIEKLNVTGPDADLGVFLTGAATPRPDTQGILVRLTGLYSNIEIFANSVDNHTEGIRLESAKGVQVGLNFAHDNNGGLSSTFAAEAHGIHLVDSTDNTIHNNLIVDNGVNVPDDSGIMLDGSFNNRVHGNNVSFSNGDGIAVQQGSANNVIDNNVILYNTSNETIPTSNPPRVFFDLVSRNTVGPNTFNSNNRCETENAAVPAAVCNSGEGEPWTKKP